MFSSSLTGPAFVIGDLVASRAAPDRAALHEELVAALTVANQACGALERLTPTIGDEFQGVFHSLYDAVDATLVVRASMSAAHDTRFGVGVGPVTKLGPDPSPQDGPGWWAARDAIDHVATGATSRIVPRSLRTWVALPPPGPAERSALSPVARPEDPQVYALNAYLVARDHLVSGMDDRDRRILQGLLLGRTVKEIAAAEGVSPSAVSQRSQRSGAAALVFSRTGLHLGFDT